MRSGLHKKPNPCTALSFLKQLIITFFLGKGEWIKEIERKSKRERERSKTRKREREIDKKEREKEQVSKC